MNARVATLRCGPLRKHITLAGKLAFAQIIEHWPRQTFRRIVARYAGERKLKSFSRLDQFLRMAFARPLFRESLCNIDAWLPAQRSQLTTINPFAGARLLESGA